jgi:hypothetical protein
VGEEEGREEDEQHTSQCRALLKRSESIAPRAMSSVRPLHVLPMRRTSQVPSAEKQSANTADSPLSMAIIALFNVFWITIMSSPVTSSSIIDNERHLCSSINKVWRKLARPDLWREVNIYYLLRGCNV